jgi:hypothetical protein
VGLREGIGFIGAGPRFRTDLIMDDENIHRECANLREAVD